LLLGAFVKASTVTLGYKSVMESFRNRLSQYVSLADNVWTMIEELNGRRRSVTAGQDIIRAGDKADEIFIVEDGWASRYRTLEDGRRQIVNFMLPGDIFDLQALANLDSDHTVSAVTDCSLLVIQSGPFLKALRGSGDVATAFWWAAVQEESILREQIVRVGRLSARERIGNLLLELRRRLTGALGNEVTDLPLPITRYDIADSLGLTPVHVSRTMSAMRRSGLIEEGRGVIRILDRDRLAKLCHFDPDYLHLRRLDFAKSIEDAGQGSDRNANSS
jgi:CRP-like cAMP-binding protein